MSIVVTGLKKLQVQLENIDEKAQQALINSALLVEGTAKEYCPVDTGQLKNSITSDFQDNVAYIGTNVEYAPYVHQGTGLFAVNGDGRKKPWSYQDEQGNWHHTKGQRPQPFLERALDDNAKKILDIFKEGIL